MVSAIHEIEYMKMVRKKFNPNFQYYVLGSVMLNSPKYVYKLNYKPGRVLCPKTYKFLKFEDVKPRLEEIMKMPKALRPKLEYLWLDS